MFGDQLACADLVILNKTDLVAPDALAALRRDLAARLRPGVKLVDAVEGRVAPAVALGLAAAAEDDLAAAAVVPRSRRRARPRRFRQLCRQPRPGRRRGGVQRPRSRVLIRAHDILRVKGFLDVPGRDRRQVVQAVGDRIASYFDRPWRAGEERASRLVVIGRKGLDRAAISAALERG